MSMQNAIWFSLSFDKSWIHINYNNLLLLYDNVMLLKLVDWFHWLIDSYCGPFQIAFQIGPALFLYLADVNMIWNAIWVSPHLSSVPSLQFLMQETWGGSLNLTCLVRSSILFYWHSTTWPIVLRAFPMHLDKRMENARFFPYYN